MAKDLLDYTINELLEKFGAGSHKPGSGSAAAMLGLIACKMTQTVIQLTVSRSKYKSSSYRLTEIKDEIKEDIEPVLKEALNEDSAQFDKVIRARIARDNESDYTLKGDLEDIAFEELRVATEIPIMIAEKCIHLTKNALEVFDMGFQAARGDSAVAVSSALSGASGAISIIYLNLVSFWGNDWAISKISYADEINVEVNKLQNELVQRINKLKREVDVSNGEFILSEQKFRPNSTVGTTSYESIEDSVRKLQNELWKNRRKIWKEEPPKYLTGVLKPEIAIKLFGYNFYHELTLGEFEQEGKLFEIAGIYNKTDKSISISNQFSPEIKNFTTAHELGHLLLHDKDLVLHRDRPLNGGNTSQNKKRVEIEADKFATYFLMPRKEVERVFIRNFKTSKLIIDQDSAFSLGYSSKEELLKEIRSEREFSRLLSKSTIYQSVPIRSLVEHFNVSLEAMAIRLEELDLFTF